MKKEKNDKYLESLEFVAGVNLSKNQAIIIQNDIWPCLVILKNSIVPSLSLSSKNFFQKIP